MHDRFKVADCQPGLIDRFLLSSYFYLDISSAEFFDDIGKHSRLS